MIDRAPTGNTSAISPLETAARWNPARPLSSAIPAERAVCRTKCSVVMEVTTAGELWSGSSGWAIADCLRCCRPD